jgi:hypothetical protein
MILVLFDQSLDAKLPANWENPGYGGVTLVPMLHADRSCAAFGHLGLKLSHTAAVSDWRTTAGRSARRTNWGHAYKPRSTQHPTPFINN